MTTVVNEDSWQARVYNRSKEANRKFAKILHEGGFDGLPSEAMNAIFDLYNAHTKNMADAWSHGYDPSSACK